MSATRESHEPESVRVKERREDGATITLATDVEGANRSECTACANAIERQAIEPIAASAVNSLLPRTEIGGEESPSLPVYAVAAIIPLLQPLDNPSIQSIDLRCERRCCIK